ncbi:unnamed protein product [Knipowitschia caucasica]|uniref:Uncharacterized protein n=1 Tax=Knipowitschia caucasica TaxID=637954 RepID=A0AAV2KUU5_KNICA
MEQQRVMFRELIQQQQENFKGFIKLIMESTNTRMDLQTKDIQELKTSLQFTQGEVDTLKEHNLKLTERTNTLQTDFYKVCDNLHIITDKLEYLEGQSRRNNLVFEGVLESPGETWADAEEKVKEILKEKLQLNHVVEVERAHRVGKPGGGRDWPRPIIARLLRWKDREEILQRAKRLKGTKILINEDESIKRKRKELMPELRAARERGEMAFLRYDKLIIRPRSSTPHPV